MAVRVTVTQLVVAVTVEAGTWIYLLQNGMASSIYLLSTSALRTLSRLHVFLSATRGVEKAGTTDSRRVTKIGKAITYRDIKEDTVLKTGWKSCQIIYIPQPTTDKEIISTCTSETFLDLVINHTSCSMMLHRGSYQAGSKGSKERGGLHTRNWKLSSRRLDPQSFTEARLQDIERGSKHESSTLSVGENLLDHVGAWTFFHLHILDRPMK